MWQTLDLDQGTTEDENGFGSSIVRSVLTFLQSYKLTSDKLHPPQSPTFSYKFRHLLPSPDQPNVTYSLSSFAVSIRLKTKLLGEF